ncbi:MAG TPA: DUF2336 domain-containing protein [Nitrobacter sp.]|nr:DUF2336 domain-containing protein [Nitrobacter sp.]
MTTPPLFPGFDGLMTLSRREGVDVRPTLLRVLTDLYVQARAHTPQEEQQFVELASRLIDQVDDATRAVVRARLSIYPHTPAAIMNKLRLHPVTAERTALATPIQADPAASQPAPPRPLPMMPIGSYEAAEISERFFAAGSSERRDILQNLAETPLRPAPKLHAARAERAIHILHMAAFAGDIENFTAEISEALILSARVAEQVVNDPGGEPLACAVKAIGVSGPVFQQMLLFLNPAVGSSVNAVYRLSRLYDALSERTALIMLAAWRGATMVHTRARYRPQLHDDERHRARSATAHSGRTETQQSGSTTVGRIARNWRDN